MTEFEKKFLEYTDFFEKIKVPIFLHGSTLLRIIRDGTVEPRPDVTHDREINLGYLDENYSVRLYRALAENFPYFNPSNNKFPNPAVFFSKEPVNPETNTHLDLDVFVYLTRYFKGKTTRLEYMGQDYFKVFPKEYFDRKNWGKIKFLGKTFNTPKGPEDYLEFYFGKDWRTENKGWHWGRSSVIQMKSDLERIGEVEVMKID